jgi:hypothetical protein
LVLAPDQRPDYGWYEALVISVNGEALTLKWRDYDEPNVDRGVSWVGRVRREALVVVVDLEEQALAAVGIIALVEAVEFSDGLNDLQLTRLAKGNHTSGRLHEKARRAAKGQARLGSNAVALPAPNCLIGTFQNGVFVSSEDPSPGYGRHCWSGGSNAN